MELQRTLQRLNGPGPFTSRQESRHRLHQPHHSEEFPYRDVTKSRLVPVRVEAEGRPRLHQIEAEPAESLGEADPCLRFVFSHLTAERAHPRGVEVRRAHTNRTWGRLPGSTKQSHATHPRPVAIQVSQTLKNIADWSVDRRRSLVLNLGACSLLHFVTASRSPGASGLVSSRYQR